VDAEFSRGDIDVVKVPATRIAEDMGSPRSANMVMLGAFTKKTSLVSLATIIDELANTLKKKEKLIAVNKKALNAGFDLF
jgi:2-oxoglutarate ferredoxin oxidoreductase subunit gamma